MGLKSGAPFRFMARLAKILKFLDIIKNWNGITCSCRVRVDLD